MKYKIIRVDPDAHSIVVRYYTDFVTEESLAIETVDGVITQCRSDFSIDLPVPTPTGDELERFITARAPKSWFDTQESVQNPNVDTSLFALIQLIGVETVCPEPEPEKNSNSQVVEINMVQT